MKLDLFNNLGKSIKENNIIQNFIEELGEFLEKNEINEQSLVQKTLNGRALNTRYRDKINIERQNIINDYSKKYGEIYYIYNKRADNNYGIVSHKNGEADLDIWVKESKLPKGAGVDSVLREENGKFVLDKSATKEIQQELTEMINKLLKEQEDRLKELRVEGHVYEFVEKSGNTVLLNDVTRDTGECFEEIDFPSELLKGVKQGDKFQFVDGEYKLLK